MVLVIKSFACKKTRALFETGRAEGFLRAIETVAKRKLTMLHFACSLADLGATPGNRLEPLKRDRQGQHSIRLNDQYRLCFRFDEDGGNAHEVEIVDYH